MGQRTVSLQAKGIIIRASERQVTHACSLNAQEVLRVVSDWLFQTASPYVLTDLVLSLFKVRSTALVVLAERRTSSTLCMCSPLAARRFLTSHRDRFCVLSQHHERTSELTILPILGCCDPPSSFPFFYLGPQRHRAGAERQTPRRYRRIELWPSVPRGFLKSS